MAENFVFNQLKRYSAYFQDYKFNYWQDYNKNEVDFILQRNQTLISIEVKYRREQKPKISAGIAHFIKKYKPQFHITATYDYFGFDKLDQCTLYYLPAYVFGLFV